MTSEAKTDFWLQHNYNVLFRGKHGVGKTAIILDAFKKHKLKYLYFSGATMDPWVDFVGVPKEFTDENNVTYLDLVRPKPFAYDDVEAIFIDELNRSPSKVRNAIMELIQFKSVNGKVFNNLRVVWAAINPPEIEGEEEIKYQTEELDPAQLDRFHVIVDLPYKPDQSYFLRKFGKENGSIAIDWWNSLSKKEKDKVSPRRLDLTIEFIGKGGDARDVLDKTINTSALVKQLNNGSYMAQYKIIMDKLAMTASDSADYQNVLSETNKLFKDVNFIESCEKYITDDELRILYNSLNKEIFYKLVNNKQDIDKFIQSFAIKSDDDLTLLSRILESIPKQKLTKARSTASVKIHEYKQLQNRQKLADSTKDMNQYDIDVVAMAENCDGKYNLGNTYSRISFIKDILLKTAMSERVKDHIAPLLAYQLIRFQNAGSIINQGRTQQEKKEAAICKNVLLSIFTLERIQAINVSNRGKDKLIQIVQDITGVSIFLANTQALSS